MTARKTSLSNIGANRHTVCYSFAMEQFSWSAEKNQRLMEHRGISFEEVVFAIQSGKLLDDGPHPNRKKYAHQRMLVVETDGYAWLVPYIENERELFFKTVIPSRKATKYFLRG